MFSVHAVIEAFDVSEAKNLKSQRARRNVAEITEKFCGFPANSADVSAYSAIQAFDVSEAEILNRREREEMSQRSQRNSVTFSASVGRDASASLSVTVIFDPAFAGSRPAAREFFSPLPRSSARNTRVRADCRAGTAYRLPSPRNRAHSDSPARNPVPSSARWARCAGAVEPVRRRCAQRPPQLCCKRCTGHSIWGQPTSRQPPGPAPDCLRACR